MTRPVTTVVLAAAAVLLAAGTSPAQAPPGPSATATRSGQPIPPEIAELRQNLIDAFNKRDVDRLLSYLHPNIVVTWQNAEVSRGHEGVRQYYEKMMVGPDSIVVNMGSNPEVEGREMYGDTSVSFGKMNDWFELRDGTRVNLNSRFSAHLSKQPDGQWLVSGFHASSDAFEGEVHNLYAKKAGTRAALIAGPIGLVLGWLVGFMLARGRRPADRTVAAP